MIGRAAALLYGLASYFIFSLSFGYTPAFLGNFLVPKTIDVGPDSPPAHAILINTILLGLFAVQHSVMARPGFKRWWTQIVPKSVERSTYVLLASLALALLYWQWRPIAGTVWEISNPVGRMAMHALFALGWIIVLLSTFMINHFDLFGLRQVWLRVRGAQYSEVSFVARGFYKFVRHPIMLGFLIAFWSTPDMTMGHLLFAIATTGYIFIGIFFEERDLAAAHGRSFQQYRREVPMILPLSKSKPGPERAVSPR